MESVRVVHVDEIRKLRNERRVAEREFFFKWGRKAKHMLDDIVCIVAPYNSNEEYYRALDRRVRKVSRAFFKFRSLPLSSKMKEAFSVCKPDDFININEISELCEFLDNRTLAFEITRNILDDAPDYLDDPAEQLKATCEHVKNRYNIRILEDLFKVMEKTYIAEYPGLGCRELRTAIEGACNSKLNELTKESATSSCLRVFGHILFNQSLYAEEAPAKVDCSESCKPFDNEAFKEFSDFILAGMFPPEEVRDNLVQGDLEKEADNEPSDRAPAADDIKAILKGLSLDDLKKLRSVLDATCACYDKALGKADKQEQLVSLVEKMQQEHVQMSQAVPHSLEAAYRKACIRMNKAIESLHNAVKNQQESK